MHGYPDLLPGPPGLRPPGPPEGHLMYHGPPPDHLLAPGPHEGEGGPLLLAPPDGPVYSDGPRPEGPDYTYLDTSDDSGRHTGPDQPSP